KRSEAKMEQLCYETLEKAGYTGYLLKNAPERVLQFGEGNFLRAFADYWFDMANEKAGWNGKCVLVQPIAQGLTQRINRQEGLYTLYLRGRQNGEKVDAKRVISSVSRCLNPYEKQDYDAMMDVAAGEALEYIVSNTTEAGIVYAPSCRLEDCPPASFPAKLTQVLLHRWRAGRPGVVVLSCELIDNNGKELLRCVNQYIKQWGLEEGFARWVNGDCTFCSTLVDRIVPGRIRDAAEAARLEDENGYRDALIDVGEVFGVWNIEGPEWLAEKLPFRAAGLNCPVVPDVTPYKKRKVRILNGAHTGFVPGAYLAGYDIVRDCMQDDVILGFMNRMLHEEVIPTLPLDRQDLEAFAAAVQDRFNNPFINHELMSITLNSTSKWRARNMPSLLEYAQTAGKLPPCLAMSFAAYIAFYSSDIQALTEQGLVCRRPKGNEYTVSDDRWVLEFYYSRRGVSDETLVHDVMTNEKMWGQDLTLVPGFEQAAAENLRCIRTDGARAAFAACLARPAV
uniref:tagaturonate reductase n=1 Tax=Ruthenibacterium lactatiformans TaxID=1550024 RepID=UPI0034A1CCE5